MPSPRTSTPSTTTGIDALLSLLFGVLGAAFGAGPWAPFQVGDAALHPSVLWPHLSATAVLIGAPIIPGLLTLSLVITGCVLYLRIRGGSRTGLARKADLAPLMGKDILAKARSLRPSLADLESKRGRTR
jgi:hypothetical protein